MAYQPLRHHQNCPYSGNFQIIEYDDYENLKKSNVDLEENLQKAIEAPELKRNVFKELTQAEARVAELEKTLEMSYFEDKHNEAMKTQLRNTTMKIAELTDDLDEVNRKNNILDQRVNEKKKLEDNLNMAIEKIGSMKRNLKLAQERSENLEKNLKETKAREGDLRTARQKLRKMEIELNGANRKLARVENDLKSANKKYETIPQELTRIYVNPGTAGRVVRSSYDGWGNKIEGTEKVMSIVDNRSANDDARSIDYRLGKADKLALEKKLAQLERDYTNHERKNEKIKRENRKLADEHRIMKEAFEKMQRLNKTQKRKITVQDNRKRAY